MNLGSDDEVRKLCLSSIEAFGKICMPKVFFAATPDFHREIYRDLQDHSLKRLGVIAPRGHSKSTLVSVLFPMWECIRKPQGEDKLIVLISESQDQAKNFLTIIKKNLAMNPRILHYFGSLEGPKWAEEEITTSNGVRIVAKGTGQRLRGIISGEDSVTRPNLIILDDFESENNSNTPEAIDKNKSWIAKAVEPSLADDGRLVAICTIINERAYMSDIRKDKAWKTHFYQAAIGDDFNTPLWPERFPTSRLLAIKDSYEARGMGDAFWQEYQNSPINKDTQLFKTSMLKYHSGKLVMLDHVQPALKFDRAPRPGLAGMTVPVNVGLGIDLAISEDRKADFTVIMPVAIDWEGYRYQLPHTRIKTGDIDIIIEEIIAKATETKAMMMNIETVQFQQAVANALRKVMEERNLYIGIRETKPRTSKDSRIRSLQPIFARGGIFLSEGQTDLESELLHYPGAAHDDTLDALYLAVDVSYAPENKPFMDKAPRREAERELSWLVL